MHHVIITWLWSDGFKKPKKKKKKLLPIYIYIYEEDLDWATAD